ncbi:hypothetical protein [Halogranum gelatinilyticum]|uniref:hypothetical protein n=1 Tax=Halogranum gelatinilyticum TaxID=660521 RepID=UPI001113A738|nr:hypothetical protein [Halogranum gelatinilyticum]
MPEFSVTGESVEELNQFTSELHKATELQDGELQDLFADLIKVRDCLKDKTSSGRAIRKNRIEDSVELEQAGSVGVLLKTLSSAGVATSTGQGGNWKYE